MGREGGPVERSEGQRAFWLLNEATYGGRKLGEGGREMLIVSA